MDENILESVADVTQKTGSITAEARRTQRQRRGRGKVEKIFLSPSLPSAPPQRSPRLSGEVLVPVDFLRIQSNLQI
jgi:protein involved in polysaccharide export with SLBB domain